MVISKNCGRRMAWASAAVMAFETLGFEFSFGFCFVIFSEKALEGTLALDHVRCQQIRVPAHVARFLGFPHDLPRSHF